MPLNQWVDKLEYYWAKIKENYYDIANNMNKSQTHYAKW